MKVLDHRPASPAEEGQEPDRMTLEELAEWAPMQASRLARMLGYGGDERDQEMFLSAQALKLGEETGELQGEVLGLLRHQRARKLDRMTTESAGNELADVLICAAIIASRIGVDLGEALASKIRALDELPYDDAGARRDA